MTRAEPPVRFAGVIVLASLLQGCIALPIPHQRPYSPNLSGSVSDAQSKQPIAGAVIWLETPSTDPPLEGSMTTGDDGNFSIRLTRRELWWPLFFGPAEGYCVARATVSAPGYVTQSREFRRFGGASGSGMCGHYAESWAVSLERASENGR